MSLTSSMAKKMLDCGGIVAGNSGRVKDEDDRWFYEKAVRRLCRKSRLVGAKAAEKLPTLTGEDMYLLIFA